jgi:hypothetical protein
VTRQEIIALAERCEKATGPDRLLGAQIHTAIDGRPCSFDSKFDCWVGGGGLNVPLYTASLDAAMTLVPEGWGYSICPTSALLTRSTSDHGVMARAATPALALTAAALRAKAASL